MALNVPVDDFTGAPLVASAGPGYFGSTLSPSALAGNVNDYAPTGHANAEVLRINPGGAGRNITGLAGGAPGRRVLLVNIETVAGDVTLKHADAASAAANRFVGANLADVVVRAGGSTLLWYDGASSRWRIVAI